MFPPVRVLAIDNEEKELQQVVAGLHEAGIPCLPLRYDVVNGLVNAPSQPYNSVRLVFVDLNLIDLGGDPAPENLYLPISQVLKSIVDNGPYLLVFWSSYGSKVDGVMDLLRDRCPDTPPPIGYAVMEKQDLLLPGKEDSEAYQQALSKLKFAIEEKIQISNCLAAICLWEARLSDACSATAGMLSSMATQGSGWNLAEMESHLSVLCGMIAKEAEGKNALEQPAKAVESGLLPLVVDHMGTKTIESEYSAAWDKALPDELQKLKRPEWLDKTALNTCYLIEECEPAKTHRGAWVPLPESVVNDDKELMSLFGLNRVDLLNDFLNLQVKGMEDSTRDEIRRSCRFGLLETSAECDFAQGKQRLYRYVLSVMIPAEHEECTYFKFSSAKRRTKNDAVYRLPMVAISGEKTIIKIHCGYALGLVEGSPLLGRPIFRLRSQLMNTVVSYYSRHTSRPGIISFH